MSRKRITTWVLVLAVGMAARIAVAAPMAAVAEIRAAACCLEHCPSKPRPPMTPHRCCAVESGATDPAGTSVAPSLERPAPIALAVLVPMPAVPAPSHAVVRRESPSLRAGPPGHWDTLKLRC